MITLKRSRTKRAAAIRTPVNLPTWVHFAAVTRTFQERGATEILDLAKADHKMPAAVTLKEPPAGQLRVLVPQTQLFGATAAVFRYTTVSRVTATMAARRPRISRLGYFGDFGINATESAVQDAIRAFTALNDILGSEQKAAKSEWGARIEFLGATITSLTVNGNREAQFPGPREKSRN